MNRFWISGAARNNRSNRRSRTNIFEFLSHWWLHTGVFSIHLRWNINTSLRIRDRKASPSTSTTSRTWRDSVALVMATCPSKSHTDINECYGNSIDRRYAIEESECYFAFQAYTCDDEKKIPYAGRLINSIDMKRETTASGVRTCIMMHFQQWQQKLAR